MIRDYFAKFIIFLIPTLILPSGSKITNYEPYNSEKISYSLSLSNDELKSEFQQLINDLFHLRNYAIVTGDTEELKGFYDLNRKVTKWAYEQEVQKLTYLNNWEEKQSVKFSSITSNVKVNKVKEKEKDLFVVTCAAATEFKYSYTDSTDIDNSFSLGTYHYINLQKVNDKYIITKEWYTDPFADSLELNNIKQDEIKKYILEQKYPEDYKIDERTQKAIDYAHNYCGLGEGELKFKYNKKYRNFNPEGGDCANFASQILFEGGNFKQNSSWCYSCGQPTTSWVNAQEFKNYMIYSGRGSYITKGHYDKIYKAAYKMRPGDFVAYEKKGRIVHISTVTGLDSKGYPLVTCHNTDRLLVPYDLGWSNDNITFHLINVHY